MDINTELELYNNMTESELVELEEAKAKRELFQKNIANVWGYSPLGIEAKKAAMSMLSTKTGLYAKVPIICKQDSCPYSQTCNLLDAGLAPYGQRCPFETAMIEIRYAEYERDYGLDVSSFTDHTLISEIINLDIQIERCKSLLSAQQVAIEDVVVGVSESGDKITKPEVSKAWELYERANNQRDKKIDMMLGTRKSRKGTEQSDNSIIDMLEQVYTQDFIIEEAPDNL